MKRSTEVLYRRTLACDPVSASCKNQLDLRLTVKAALIKVRDAFDTFEILVRCTAVRRNSLTIRAYAPIYTSRSICS
jgi:hypothetical protein